VRPAHPPRSARLLAAAALAGAGVTAGGCAATNQTSAGNFQGDANLAAKTVNSLQSAARSKDKGKVCNQILSQAVVTALNRSPGGCQRAVSNQFDDTDNFDLTILANGVQVNGTLATVRVKDIQSGHTHFDTLTLVKESGSWRINGVAP
jgi:hypothetical protein